MKSLNYNNWSQVSGSYAFMLKNAFDRFGSNSAIIENGNVTSWSALRKNVYSLVNAFSRIGVHSGDRVAIFLENSTEFVEVDRIDLTESGKQMLVVSRCGVATN